MPWFLRGEPGQVLFERGFFHQVGDGTLTVAGAPAGPDLWEGELELPYRNVQLAAQAARAQSVADGHPPDAPLDLLALGNYLRPCG